MIAFACVTVDEREFRAHAARGIEAAAENSSLLMRRHQSESTGGAFNEMLAEAVQYRDLEAVVLLHGGTSIEDEALLSKVRSTLAMDPSIAIIGVGAEPNRPVESDAIADVDHVDGMLMVLSPWAAKELRFDRDSRGSMEICSMDVCKKACDRERRVVSVRFGVSDHRRSQVDRPACPAAASAYEVSANGRKLIGPQGNSIPIRSGAVRGYVDSASAAGDHIDVVGWAAPADLSGCASRIVGIVGGKGVETAEPFAERQDVATAYQAPALGRCGFVLSFDHSFLERSQPRGGLAVFGIAGDVAAELPWTGESARSLPAEPAEDHRIASMRRSG